MGFKETADRIKADLKRWYAWPKEKIQALGEDEYWRIVRKLERDFDHFDRLARR